MESDGSRIRVHVVSETEFYGKGQGVHTAFVDCVNLLRRSRLVDVVVNGEGRGDVLHSHTYGPYYFWKGIRYRGRRVFTVHVIPDSTRGSLPAEERLMPFVRWYLRRVYNYADVCVSISPAVSETLRAMGVESRIVEIVNPIRTERFFPCAEKRAAGRRLLGVADDAFVVLGVGQLERRKGVEDFIDIALACPEMQFVWVGGRPLGAMTEGISRINQRIQAVQDRVRFAGLLDLEQMPLAYNAADLFLFPSYQENCPLAPLEAAACGLPVVYRDLPEYRSLYRYPYLSAKSTDEFVELTRRFRDDPAFAAEAREISERLLAQFREEDVLAQLENVYRELAGARGRDRAGIRAWHRRVRRRVPWRRSVDHSTS